MAVLDKSSDIIFIRSFNINLNFWEENAHAIYVFKNFYKNDKSKNKEYSSKIMWGVVLMFHPKSDYSDIEFLDRLKFVKDDYLGDINFDLDELEEIIDIFKKHCLTREQRFLSNLAKKLDERDAYLESLPYTIDNFETLEKALKNSKDIMNQYLVVKSLVEQEDDATYGSVVESASEKGDI